MKITAYVTALALAGALQSAGAQDYPIKPVRVITGFPGSMMDIVLRELGKGLSERWSQPVVVENRGRVSAALAAQATPDGYTLLLSDQTVLAVRPILYKNLPYNTLQDFVPITLVASAPGILVAHPSVPANTLEEFVAYAKRQPGGVDFATAGPVTGAHLAAEELKHATGINVVPVHYRGGGAALVGILSGEAKAGFSRPILCAPHIKTGALKAYSITGNHRFPDLPDVPTVAEAGFPKLVIRDYWIGLMAPARTPPMRLARINHDVTEALKAPEFRSALLRRGAEPATPETSAQFTAFIRSETKRFKQLIDMAGIRAE